MEAALWRRVCPGGLTGATLRMRPYFISYRRNPWGPEVLRLSAAFRRRGLRTIVDVSDPERLAGQAQYDELRRIIREDCDGLVLYTTGNLAESACIWKVEVPAALEALDHGDFHLLPLFRDVTPSGFRAIEPHGRRIAALAGVIARIERDAEEGPAIAAVHAEAASVILGGAVLRRAQRRGQETMVLGVRTREAGVHAADADLLLDWTSDYPELLGGNRAPSSLLVDALADTCRALGAAGTRAIRIEGPAHLSASLAVGHAFQRASGFQLEAAQRDVWWPADGERVAADVRIATQQLDPGATDLVLTVALSRPEIIGDVDATLGEIGGSIGGRIVVEPTGGAGREAIRSASHARGIVVAVTDALMKARAEWGTRGPTHIFMACPFAFAALLGHALNGFGRLALYEPNGKGRYARVLELS